METLPKSFICTAILGLAFSSLALKAAPVITGIAAGSGKPTAGGVTIQIQGTGLAGTTNVTIGSSTATIFSTSAGLVQVILPPGQGTDLPLILQATDGNTSTTFSYDLPLITTLDYTVLEGATQGGGEIEIKGVNFGTAAGVVDFAGNLLSPTTQNHASITFTLPEGQGPGVLVSVTVAGQASNTAVFNYSPPLITGVTPARALSSSVEEVTVNGVNFGTAYQITYDSVTVIPNETSHTQFTFDKPVDTEGGDKEIVVTRQAETSPAFTFRSVALTSLPGYYIDLENEVVLPAPVGKYTDQADMLEPISAPVGFYAPIPGMRAPIPASKGYYVPNIGSASQLEAPLGRVAPVEQMETTHPAPPGFYAPVRGMRAAIPASRGHYVDSPGQSAQSAADPGFFVSSTGQSSQSGAVPGRYAPVGGMHSTLLTPPGFYTDSFESVDPSPAEPGHYVPDSGSSTQLKAGMGHYTPFPGMRARIPASRGHFVATDDSASQQPARIGRFSGSEGLSSDISAPIGTYAPIEGLHAAIAAPEGTFSPTIGAAEVQRIPAGFTSNDGGATIEPLPQLTITAYTLQPNGDNTLSFETVSGQTYGIFYTENLVDFTRILLVPGSGGIVTRTFTPPATTSGKRFYVVGPTAEP